MDTASSSSSTSDHDPVPQWFEHMDTNHDGVISRREFLGDENQFQSLDANRDLFVEPDEVAQSEAQRN